MKNTNEFPIHRRLYSINTISEAAHIYVKQSLKRCKKMANCGSSMHLCILQLGQRDRMMLLRHDQQQTGSLDSLRSLQSTFTHLQPGLMHHSFHRNKKFHCEIHVPPTYTTTCTISAKEIHAK